MQEGIAQATLLGKFLNEGNHAIDLILSSDTERATSTAALIATEINYPLRQIAFSEKIYSGILNDLLTLMKATPDTKQNVMIVGHYPTVLELNNYLTDTKKLGISTCELILLEIEAGWSDLKSGSGKCILNHHPSC